MTRVFVGHYTSFTWRSGGVSQVKHPLVRRMSPLQIATLEVFAALEKRQPELVEELMRRQPAPLIYATCLGEVDSTLKVVDCLRRNMFPVSPTAFQHSVDNSPAAYVSILNGSRQEQLVISSGLLSYDKAIHRAFYGVASGMSCATWVVVADQRPGLEDKVFTEAEVVLIMNSDVAGRWGADFELARCEYGYSESIVATEEDSFQEDPANISRLYPLNLNGRDHSFCRRVTNKDHEFIMSQWVKISR